MLLELEGRKQAYLLRLRQTANVQRLVARQFARSDWSRPDSQGCQMVEDQLQLHGWSRRRRVVIVRQGIKGGIARERRVDGRQLKLDLAGPNVHEGERLREYAVMVTDVAHPLEAVGQLYNWWNWYCRAANPSARMEAITSRPLLLAAVGKAASHAGQTTLYLTPMHDKATILKSLTANIRAALQHVRAASQ